MIGDGDHCEVEVHIPDVDSTELRLTLTEELRGRLSDEEVASLESVPGEAVDEDVEGSEGDAETEAPNSYLASLYGELVAYDQLDADRRSEMDEFVKTMTTPGLIMDGQHRIFGAKDALDGSIVLPLVLVPGLEVAEQVFNFYVLNNKAKPLDKRQLRSIIATSLTEREISDLYARFSSSGLRADEAQWTYRVHTDTDSPFRGLISLKLSGDDAPIDDNVMDQVVSRFIKMPRTYNPLKNGVKWEVGDPDYSARLSLFYALWRAVRDSYPEAWAKAVKGPGQGQLFQKVALLQLQEFVLEVLKQVVAFQPKSPLASPEDLYEATQTALAKLPEAFFLKEWKKKGLDTGVGKSFFLDQIRRVVSADGKNVGNFALFRAE